MRQTAMILAILLFVSILAAAGLQEYQTTASGLRAAITELRAAPLVEDNSPDNDDGLDTISYTSKTFALPYESISLQINSMRWNVFDQSGTFLYTEDNLRDGTAVVANSFTFRDMRGHTVKIRAQFTEGNLTRTLHSIDFSITGSNPVSIPESLSPAFVQSYKSLADNWETSYLRYLPVGRPQMLIISHAPLAPYQQDYINWRKQKGFEVYVLNKADLGNNVDQIKAGISAHYAQYRPDYLLLLGDVTGTYSIPCAFYPSPEYQENDADDQTYALLEGEDYFPEMLVGRFSFGNISELITMLNKTVSYEKTPYMDDTTWMRRALTVAGNWAEGTLRPTTPIHMSRWLRDRFLDYGYATVDTVYFPPTFPGTSLIQSSISQGLQYISYRGWGDANGWHYPSFHNPDLDVTFNGPKMPVVFSIVCNTGDFANNNVNPCFGEKWMRMGTTAAPGGAIAFVGPSDLHTKTRLNNSISSGAFRAMLDNNVRIFGSSVLEGKIELYKNFPNDLAANQYVPFYFHVYNMLSDPALNMWSLVPSTIAESVFTNGLTFAQSDTHVQINATNLDGATITATKDGQNFSYAKVENGIALIAIDPSQTGDLLVTISKENMVPLQRTLTVTASAPLSLNSINVIPQGTNFSLQGFLKNNSTGNLTDIFVEAECYNTEMVTFPTSTWSIENLAAGAQTEFNFGVDISEIVNPRVPLIFRLKVKRNNQLISTHIYSYQPINAQFSVLNHSGVLLLGQNSPISFEIKNTGNRALANASLIISSLTNAAVASSTPIQLGAFAIGETKTVNTNIQVAGDTYNGRNIQLHFQMNGSDVFFPSNYYTVIAGTPSSTDPTGPCSYGYFAYDSTDQGFAQAPVYNWVEIDPLLGGQAEVFPCKDDGSRVVNLPFQFRYFGIDYDQITICSNGWISFGPTDMFDFYNHYIPAALGPYAMVAGYWDDLKGERTGTDGDGNGIYADMRMLYWHDAANSRYIVQWNNAYNQYNVDSEDPSLEKFQIILYPRAGQDGDIVIQYHTVDNPGTTTNYCTVGIENHLQLDGLTYTHGNQYPITSAILQNNLAIKFTTTPPDNYVANSDAQITPIFRLNQNYPNPFNPSTTISFHSPVAGPVQLVISNLRGQIVRTLLDGELASGDHSLVWNGTDDNGDSVSSGLYFYRLQIGNHTQTRKMLMMK